MFTYCIFVGENSTHTKTIQIVFVTTSAWAAFITESDPTKMSLPARSGGANAVFPTWI
jgi:hypothetical protein